VEDGRYDVTTIVSAINAGKSSTSKKPLFINIRTVIGVDMSSSGTAKAHHGGFDQESISSSKTLAGLAPSSKYEVPQNTLQYLRECRSNGTKLQMEWESLFQAYKKENPQLALEFELRQRGEPGSYQELLDKLESNDFAGLATRESNGILLEKLWKACPSLCGGGSDLVNSNKILYTEKDVFLPQLGYKGRYIRNGIREHAMASIANGMAAYAPGTFLPITATFFMFYIYVRSSNSKGLLSS
jgi:dihydroxyacetone synthase